MACGRELILRRELISWELFFEDEESAVHFR